MSSTKSAAFPHIVRIPGVVGGEPVIDGTRVPVRSIVIHIQVYGNLDRVTEAYPRVSRAVAEEALAYYRVHQEEIDRYIAENECDSECYDE